MDHRKKGREKHAGTLLGLETSSERRRRRRRVDYYLDSLEAL